MKKEASGKKGKWLWLVLALVALLAVVGVVLALVLGGGGGKEVGGRPDLYWNVDREANVDRDTGLSIREAAEDGNYYVRFAHDGEQVEIPVADKKLVNFIDSLDLMSLQLDDDGYVVDIFPVADVASIIGESLYVQSVNGNTIIANSSIMMNGRKITVEVNDEAGVYNVSGKGEFVGEALDPSTLNPMDTISIYGTLVPEDSEEDPVVTHVYVLNKPAESEIYFRADQFYDSTNKVTTREPDENGAYTIKWYCNGETVDLKCKDKDMVTTIDSANYHWCHWGLEFDEEGYIIDILDSFLASRTLMQCERYDITEVYEDGSYTATSLIKNNGAFVQGVVGADCPIYDISSTAKSEGQDNRKVDSLMLGDRVCIWTDTMGNPVHIYVTRRQADSVGYWNITRSYNSTTKQTSRKPNDNGMYEIEMLKAGDTKNAIYYTDDIEIATAVDKTADYCVGLKVGEGNKIECVYDIEAVFGYTYFVRGYYIMDATGSVCTYLSPSGSGYTKTGVLAADAKVWNISTIGKYGAETTLQVGDYVYAGKTPIGEIAYAYVLRRALTNGENKFYWRTDSRQYDTKAKVTTREPDAEGYYVYEFAHKGKLVTLKTKNKEFANALDYQSSAPAFALEVKGDIITAVHDGTYAYGGSRINGWTVLEINGDKFTAVNSTGTTTSTHTMIDNCEIYNVSNSFTNNKGEKTTLKVGDVIAGYRNMEGQMACIMVKTRRTNKIAWPVAPDLNRQRAEDGWFYIDLAVDGKIQTFKCKSENVIRAIDEYTSPFGIQVVGNEILYMSTTTYVEGVKGSGVTTVTVESVSGSSVKIRHTLGAAEKVGTTETITLASGAKVYDVSETAKAAGTFGSSVKLQKGDVIRTYRNADSNQLYIYVIARQTRDVLSYCAHCDKAVYWTPYVPSSNAGSYDAHYYLATDLLNICAQIRVYSTARDFEIVLDLNGKTISREGGRAGLIRYGDTLTIIDSSEAQTGKIMSKNNTSNGGVFMVSGDKTNGIGVLNIGCKVGDKYIYGGTITLDETGETFSSDGGLITNSGTVNLYNGKLLNGFAKSKDDGASGGAINTSGTFNMYGGEITGGKVEGWHVVDGVKKMYTGAGGNISTSGTTNIYGGVIQNGVASRGGNVSVTGGTFTLHGGQIINGTADLANGKSTDARGGNIFSTGDVYIKGGTVTGGKTVGKDYGGNIMSTGLDDTLYIQGGTVSGGTYVNGETVKLSNIYLMYSNIEVTGGEINGGEMTGTMIGGTGTNTGGYSTITIAGGTIKGDVNGGGSVTTIKDNAGQKYYTSEGKDINVYFREDGTAYTLNSKNKEVAFYPNYKSIINLKGGKVEGTVNAGTTQQINVSGNPVINMLKIGGNMLNVSEMSSGASITTDAVGVISNAMASKAAVDAVVAGQYIKSTNSELILGATAKNELKIYHPDAITAYCEHCDGDADFIPTDALPTGAGHYVLTGNVNADESATIAKGVETVLDLAGYTIAAGENVRPFYVDGGELVIMDSSDAETGMITGGRATRGGNIYVSSGSFTLMSGTIANGVADNDLGTSSTNGRGGNIFSNGDVILLGGKVINGSVNGGSNYGGNIMVTGRSADLVIGENAVVADGTASTGSNVTLMYSNLVLDGGQILNGGIYTNGTNGGGYSTITVNDGVIDGTVTMSGGVTTDEVAYPDYRTILVVNGGEIEKIDATKAFDNKVTLTGKPVINNLILGSDVLVDATAIEADASVTLNVSGVFTVPFADKASAEAVSDCFVVSGKVVTVSDNNELQVEVPPVVTETLFCEHCNQPVEFTQWLGGAIDASGHYFLTDDVTLTAQVHLNDGVDVVIDLNGHKIQANGCRAFYLNGGTPTLSIQDSVGTGEITGGNSTGYSNQRGGNIYASGGNVHLYGGKIYGGTAGTGNYAGHDIAVYNGEFTVDGNVQIGSDYDNGHAVFVFNATSTNLTKGSVTGSLILRGTGAATLGSEFNVDAIALWTAKLAVVEERNSSEQIVVMLTGSTDDFMAGVFTDVLTNATTAANYFVAAETGYEIVANTDGTLEIKASGSGEPDPGPGTDPEPTGVYCKHCGQTVTTWEVWDGVSAITSGHFYLEGPVTRTAAAQVNAEKDFVLDLRGQTITADGSRAFYVSGGATLSILDSVGGGVITGGTSTTARGGNIYATGANVKLYGGKIYGGTSEASLNNDGNDVAVYNGEFVMDGNVEIGQAYDAGHALYLFNNTALTLTEGKVIGGLQLRTDNVTLGDGMVIDAITIRAGLKLAAVGNLTLTDPIALTITNNAGESLEGIFTAALDNAATAVNYFVAANTEYTVVKNDDNTLAIAASSGNEPGGDPDPVVPSVPTNCEHCDEPVEWIAWDENTLNDANEIVAGHYYLTGDVTVEGANIAVKANNDVVIDLMGFDIKAPADTRAFYVYGTLSIQDSSAEKTGEVIGGTVSGANGGTIYVTTNATLNLYSGTVRGGSAQRGGNIFVGVSGTTFNMYGGTVTGGVADQSLTTGTSTTNARGGNIFANGGDVNLEGGTISDGVTLLNSAGKGSSWAGNILMNGGTLTVKEGVVIENGTAKSGANLYLVAATLNMTGGQINDGVATDGRTVCITGTAGAGASTLNISNGTFNGGVIALEGSEQLADSNANPPKEYVDYRTVVNITGGTFDCQIIANKAFGGAINVSGATKISSIKLGEGVVLNPGALAENAEILIDAEPGAVITAAFTDTVAAEAVLPYVDTVAIDQKVEVSENKLTIVAACACGCKATDVVWEDANAYMAARAEAGTVKINDGAVHHLKLSANLNIVELYGAGKQIQVIDGSKVSIDLNGFTWSTENERALYVGANSELTIINTAETEGFIKSNGSTKSGGVINSEKGILNLRGGTIMLTSSENSQVITAGVVYLNGDATTVFNMYGGKIVGGKITSTSTKNAYGGNIYVYAGTFNMYGGTISGGIAEGIEGKPSYGGNLCARDHSSVHVNLYGGLITGGSADNGADIYDAGNKVTIGPDMVVCSSVTEYFEKYITVVDDAGYVLESMTFKLGADFSVADYFENATQIHIGNDETPVEVTIDLNGYTWTGNHRLYVHAGSTLNIKDSSEAKTGVIQSTGFGTNSGRIMTSYGTVNIYGGNFKMVESQDVNPTGAGLIYISKGVLNIYGGVIEGGKVAASASKDAFGGNIYVYSGILNMYGGTIKNGTATASAEKSAFGGNICIRSLRTGVTSELNLYGGTIEGGEAVEGSSIYVDTGVTYTKTDATIENEETSVVVAPAAS